MVTARERVPVPRMTRAHGEHTWLWIGLSAIIVALLAGGITWIILRPAPTAPALPASVVGFEYFQEATTGIVADPGITSVYVGLNPTFDPDVVSSGLLVEASPIHVAAPGVTTQYLGNSGELFADE